MAKKIYYDPSRTLMEFRLLPGLTSPESAVNKISLRTPMVYSDEQDTQHYLNLPLVSAAMQSVSGAKMGIEMAKLGGLSFIFCSQAIKTQAEMVSKIKNYKAGFVEAKTILPDATILKLHETSKKLGFSTFPVVDENNKLIGIIKKYDYDKQFHANLLVKDRMIPISKFIVGTNISDLHEANNILIDSHQSVLPIVDQNGKLLHLVFRKDIQDHLNNPLQLVDKNKRLLAGAAINTHDYKDRVDALVEAQVDVILVDSSDGHSFYQGEVLQWISNNYPQIPLIAGNVITGEGFDYLVEAGGKAVKVGMGGGSICITQEQKGTGRGLATSIIKVSEARDRYYAKTGKYIPVIADGGIVNAKDVVIALALGADYVMMGRYFARMEESPTEKIYIDNKIMKPYWGEGSPRAREWKTIRYHQAQFDEGVEGFVEYAGRLRDNIEELLAKIKSAISTSGASTIKELHEKAELELVSALSIREGKVHDIYYSGNMQNLQMNQENY